MFSVHTVLEKFGNGGFTLKMHQMFSVHIMPENSEMQQSLVILKLCLREMWAGKYHDCHNLDVFEKACFLLETSAKRKQNSLTMYISMMTM